MRSINNLTN